MPLSKQNLFHLDTFAKMCADELPHEHNTTLSNAHLSMALHFIAQHKLYLDANHDIITPRHPLYHLIQAYRHPNNFTILGLKEDEYAAARFMLLQYFYSAIAELATDHAVELTECRQVLRKDFQPLSAQSSVKDFSYLVQVAERIAHRLEMPLVLLMLLTLFIVMVDFAIYYGLNTSDNDFYWNNAMQGNQLMTGLMLLHSAIVIDLPKEIQKAHELGWLAKLSFLGRTLKQDPVATLLDEVSMSLPLTK